MRLGSWRACPLAIGTVAMVAGFMMMVTAGEARAQKEPEESKDSKEPKEFRFEFSLFGGGHFFAKEHGLGRYETSPADFSPAHGPAFGGRLTLNFNRWVSLEGEALAIPTHMVNDLTKMWIFGYRGSLLIHFIGSGPFRPFIAVGYGGMSLVANNNSVVPTGNESDGFVHAGLGFKIAFGQYVGLRLEGRVVTPPSFAADVIPVGEELGYGGPDFEALGGLYVNFGEIERSTIVKREVVMMPPPASPDPDGDGILGKADKCPTQPEDKDGYEDEDGCPELDNDGDEITDALDKCPLKPETKNGIDDDDGCPEVDSDGDGILGSRDRCPDEPETKNKYQDEDGCPDEIPQAVKRFTGVIEGINFKTGQANILPGSYAILDRAVSVLKEYADVRLEISGHTDSRGKADYNRDLSQRRADAVKMYFIANGVDANRLTSIGYGLDRPIGDNKSEAGRAKNRRTEFRLITAEEAGGAAAPAPKP
jgi:OOP family OmpA-OmpF porin